MPPMTKPSERFALNLKQLRAASGLSQEEAAFRAALHRTQISLLESGERMPRVETLVKLAGALGATPNDLLAGITWAPIIVVEGGLVVVRREESDDFPDAEEAEGSAP
jgi:transcriptional regulator with XRE-family HTH domain